MHFNSKNEIAKRMSASPLGDILTEVRVGAYYQNMVKLPQLYGPQKAGLCADMEKVITLADSRIYLASWL